jgi:hypothetical protein
MQLETEFKIRLTSGLEVVVFASGEVHAGEPATGWRAHMAADLELEVRAATTGARLMPDAFTSQEWSQLEAVAEVRLYDQVERGAA